MSKANIQFNDDFLQTHVPNFFIDKHMPTAEPVYSLIYIYLLRHGEIDTAEIAKTFDITEAKCIKALKHWESAGLLKYDDKSETLNDRKEPEIETITEADITTEPTDNDSLGKPLTLQIRPSYSAEEIEGYKQHETIGDLFEFAQEKFGRMLKYQDLNFLFGLYDWLRMDINVIKKLIDYCAENSHTNISYIETVALDWSQRNIKTVEDADNYILTFTKTYREILKAFGLAGRNPVPKEIEYMENWLNKIKMPLDLILEACDKTIMAIGKPNFKYANTIIEFWHKADVKTIDDIIKLEDAFSKEEALKPKSRKKTKFANFEGRKIDYNEIEKLEQEYIDSIVKGK